MDHERHVTHVLRGVAQTLMLPRLPETPAPQQRLAYLVDDVTRGRVSPMRHDAEQLAAVFVLRLGAWQFRDLKSHVVAAYHQLTELPTGARLVVLSVAVDELALPHRGEAERAAVAQALAVIATLVPPECYRADADVDDALRGGA